MKSIMIAGRIKELLENLTGRVRSGHAMSCNLNQNMEGETSFLQLIDSNHEKIQLMSKVI